MPDIIVGHNDDDVIGDARGSGGLWTDVKTLGKKRTYVRVNATKDHAVRTRQGEVHTEYGRLVARGRRGLELLRARAVRELCGSPVCARAPGAGRSYGVPTSVPYHLIELAGGSKVAP